jgi:hypothetical protein
MDQKNIVDAIPVTYDDVALMKRNKIKEQEQLYNERCKQEGLNFINKVITEFETWIFDSNNTKTSIYINYKGPDDIILNDIRNRYNIVEAIKYKINSDNYRVSSPIFLNGVEISLIVKKDEPDLEPCCSWSFPWFFIK